MDKVIHINEETTITEKEYSQIIGLATIGATVVWGTVLYGGCKVVEGIATFARKKRLEHEQAKNTED